MKLKIESARVCYCLAILHVITQTQFVWSLTLSAGQRIQSRPSTIATATILRHGQYELQQQQQEMFDTSTSSTITGSSTTSKRKTSIFDIPQVELWASERGLKEHHLKRIYHVVMNSFPYIYQYQHHQRHQHEEVNNRIMDDDDDGDDNDNSDFGTMKQSQLLFKELLQKADFPKRHLHDLLDNFCICTSRIVEQRESASGGIKFIIQQQSRSRDGGGDDNNKRSNNNDLLIETVLIQHTHKTSNTSRYTVCVSSQVGCAKGCSFCATGTMGLLANLSSADILEQVWLVRNALISSSIATTSTTTATATATSSSPRSEDDDEENNNAIDTTMTTMKDAASSLRNVVFMGMGEPLDNYDAVHEACRGLTHQCLFGFRGKHVTISTVGDNPRVICDLARDAPQISLALSLHGATQKLRTTLIKSAKHSPLSDLEDALDYHAYTTGQGAMLEYLLIDHINDKPEDADALVQFCSNRAMASSTSSSDTGSTTGNNTKKPFVNLIPYNPTLAGGNFGYQTPSDKRVEAFHQRLRTNGVHSLVRWTSASGRDANGACGQLALTLGNQK